MAGRSDRQFPYMAGRSDRQFPYMAGRSDPQLGGGGWGPRGAAALPPSDRGPGGANVVAARLEPRPTCE